MWGRANQSLLITARNDVVCSNGVSFSAAVARMFASWLNRRRWRYSVLILCSPLLVPLIIAACPFVCAVEMWWLVRRKRRRRAGGDGWSRGGGDEVGLMQRYLEDQLMQVVGSMCDCGGGDRNAEEEEGCDVEYCDSARPLLQ